MSTLPHCTLEKKLRNLQPFIDHQQQTTVSASADGLTPSWLEWAQASQLGANPVPIVPRYASRVYTHTQNACTEVPIRKWPLWITLVPAYWLMMRQSFTLYREHIDTHGPMVVSMKWGWKSLLLSGEKLSLSQHVKIWEDGANQYRKTTESVAVLGSN